MGRLRALAQSDRFRLWATTVLPTSFVFLLAGLVIRAVVQHEIVQKSSAPESAKALAMSMFTSGYVVAGSLFALVMATVLSLWIMKVRLRRLFELSRLAKEMAGGNYAVRAQVEKSDTAIVQALASDLNALADSLERTDRQRRELVANLAHEIRTPLTNLQGYLEALRDGVIEPTYDSLASVHEEVMRLVRLVDALHQLARADSLRHHGPPVSPVEMDRLVDGLVQVAKAGADAKRITVLSDMGARGKFIPVHVDSIAQVIRNLLKNAIQYTNEGGTIRVQTAVTESTFYFTIINTGQGIAPEELPFIFQRFYRSERAKQASSLGVGLGLAICKELVEAHGGRIGADSKAGWTTFWFELPLEPSGETSGPTP